MGMTDSWPVDADGRPMVLVTGGAEEKIGLPNYSNVTIGPISVTKFFVEGDEAEGIRECARLAEAFIAEERERVLKWAQGGGK